MRKKKRMEDMVEAAEREEEEVEIKRSCETISKNGLQQESE